MASFSAAMASGARGRPLLTPLQSLKAPACQLASGWQYPYSEQQGAEAGHPRGHFTARALKGAAAQLPSPVAARCGKNDNSNSGPHGEGSCAAAPFRALAVKW